MNMQDAWREIIQRRIALTPVFDGKLWAASVDVKGRSDHNRKRAVRSVSATASSPIGAIVALIEKLNAEAQPQRSIWTLFIEVFRRRVFRRSRIENLNGESD